MSNPGSTKMGIVGCGNISGIYFEAGRKFPDIVTAACADLIPGRAKERAEKYGVPKHFESAAELLADPEIGIVANLTIPKAHAEVALMALAAGKSVYNEKPLAVTREDGARMLKLAKEKNLRVGGAPDTFLGAGYQTCRKLMDSGAIGTPVAATAFLLCHGHESWHPDPDFYYQPGGGPMFDMGPYYLTALVSLLGPVRRVAGSARITFPERVITSEPKKGTVIKVNTPTHIAGIMDFASGAVGTIVTSFDVWAAQVPRIEIYGTEGTLSCPDPNGFGGPIRIFRPDKKEAGWAEIPLTHANNHRGLGIADMARGIRLGRPHRASGELAYHVLDIMHAFHDSSRDGRHVEMASTCDRPAPLKPGLPEFSIDD
jgi:predicted dehydrogenase